MENTTQIYSNTLKIINVTFSWYDYILFSAVLLLSTIIGIYFGCFGTKQSTTSEYLMGSKTMKVIPIAISLVASHVSGITLLALPADVYRYGAAYWLSITSMIILIVVTVFVYLPVFYNQEITSTYEYLERRFDNKTRLFASFLFTLSVILYLPIVIYLPALAFAAATHISVHLVAIIVCGICIFYTTIGGFKAVVWTDTLQFTITIGALIAVFILGIRSVGGITEVWRISIEGKRLDVFDFDVDPTKRDGFWSIFIGLTIHWISHTSVNQGCLQKFLALPTLRKSKLSVLYYGIGMMAIKSICVVLGLTMYAKYSNCDPFTTKIVTRNDQLLPYFVMDVAGQIPGLSGLFIAGIFSAALSTLSATLNCLAGTIYEDFIKNFAGPQMNPNLILKLIVIVTGIVSTLLVFVVENLGGLLPLAISLGGVTYGPLLGLFTLGVLFPQANSKGAFYGSISGLIFMGWIVIMNQFHKARGVFDYAAKPLSTDGCVLLNKTLTNYTIINSHNASTITDNSPFFLFRLSYYYYTFIGTIFSMIIGLIISCLTKSKDDKPVKKELLSPVIYPLLPKNDNDKSYYNIEVALQEIIKNTTEK